MDRLIKKIDKHVSLPALDVIAPKKRVAAYARVSTNSAEQLNSIEAQRDYYLRKITENPVWEFAGIYADEGISGVSQKNRPEFLRLITDVKRGKIDLIITKSISRFARNTVDTLSCIRKIKDCGCGVYFEKENLYSLDSHGEFILTLLSSLAQEESRNISENVAWGTRKRFSDGKFSLPYSRFLGYTKGTSSNLTIVHDEATVIRFIYRLFLQGNTPFAISRILMDKGISTPSGSTFWHVSTVESILSNEKYKGDALLQKRYTPDFLTKKSVINNGFLPKYYVTDSHPAIIKRDTFDYVQEEILARRGSNIKHSCTHPLSALLICPKCGGHYHTNYAHHKLSWRCENNPTHGLTPTFMDLSAMNACKKAIRLLFLSNIDDCKKAFPSSELSSYLEAFQLLVEDEFQTIEFPLDDFRVLVKKINVNMDRTLSIHFFTGDMIRVNL